jgi:hypothetical protein
VVGFGVNLDFCGRVFRLQNFLGENVTRPLDLNDSQFFIFDANYAFKALS